MWVLHVNFACEFCEWILRIDFHLYGFSSVWVFICMGFHLYGFCVWVLHVGFACGFCM